MLATTTATFGGCTHKKGVDMIEFELLRDAGVLIVALKGSPHS
jgi:hypothetical protein